MNASNKRCGDATHITARLTLSRRAVALTGALLLAMWAGEGRSATFCAHDAAELNAALTSAGSNGEPDIVRLAPGTYTPTSNSTFVLTVTDNAAIVMGGGFDTPAGGTPCSLQLRGASHTVLDGLLANRLLSVAWSAGSSAPFTLFNLTLKGGKSTDVASVVGIFGQGWTGNINLAGLSVRDNDAAAKVVRLQTQGTVTVLNSEFAGNIAQETALAIQSTGTAAGANAILFNGNTVTDNAAPNAVVLDAGTTQNVRVSNSIVRMNVGPDVSASGTNVFFDHSDIGVRSVTGTLFETNAVNVEPVFAGPGDYRLAPDSPLIDAGLNSAPGGTGEFDVDGMPRVLAAAVDIGAHEFFLDVIFADGFEP